MVNETHLVDIICKRCQYVFIQSCLSHTLMYVTIFLGSFQGKPDCLKPTNVTL